MRLKSLAPAFEDVRVFGLATSLKAFTRKVGTGMLDLDIPGHGTISIRRQDSDFDTVRQIFRDREYDVNNDVVAARLRHRYDAILSQGGTPVIVDAGANIGAASIWFTTLYPKAAVIAVEPDQQSAVVLRLNTARHASITVVEAAIGASPGFAAVSKAGPSWG